MKVYDVSVPLRADMPTYDGEPGPSLDFRSLLSRGDSMTISALSLGSHTGTHVDAPAHFLDGAPAADSLPFQELADIGEKEKLDGVFCTVGIACGATPETGFEIVRLTKPQLAVPYHTNSAAYQQEFAEIVKKELPRTACLIPELNKIYQVSKRK